MSERQERLLELLDHWRQTGQSPAEVCADFNCPELLSELEQQIRFQRGAERHAGIEAEPQEASLSEIPLTLRPQRQAGQVPLSGPGIPDIPNHDILGWLGAGGMGAVYKGHDRRIGRIVALKVIKNGLPGTEQLARFQTEAETLARLNHHHIVQVYEVGWWRSPEGAVLPFLALEYIEGGTLEKRLGRQPAEPIEAIRLLRLLARAIQKAHQKGIIHRDLKPGNVLLAPPDDEPALNCAWGLPKLTDFGLARVEGVAGLTVSGTPLGTPSYMSPEQARGKVKEVGPATDVYGLGAILYQLLTGQPPFQGDSAVETLHRVITETPVSPRRVRPVVPEALDRLCLRCLEKDPAQRPSVAALIEELARILREMEEARLREQQQREAEKLQAERTLREAFALPPVPRRGGGSLAREVVNSIGMKFVLIPAGAFVMGSPAGEIGRREDEQRHEVQITRPFWLGVYPVTQGQWRAVMGNNPSWFSETGRGKEKVQGLQTDDVPVESVSWEDAQTFLERLSALPQEKEKGRKYRLPTEAEWEYSCRGGANSYQIFHQGNSLSSKQANFDGNDPYGGAEKGPYLERTCQVGSYPANAFGLFDMHGNVWEWCADWYDVGYYAQSPREDPPGPAEGPVRVIRGGSWRDRGVYCRASRRDGSAPSDRGLNLGFRLALVPSESK